MNDDLDLSIAHEYKSYLTCIFLNKARKFASISSIIYPDWSTQVSIFLLDSLALSLLSIDSRQFTPLAHDLEYDRIESLGKMHSRLDLGIQTLPK